MSNYILCTNIFTKLAKDINVIDKMLCDNETLEVKNYEDELLQYFGRRYSKKIDKTVQAFIFVAEKILEKLNLTEEEKDKVGIFIGNNYASWDYVEEQMYGLYRGDPDAINAYVATAWFPAAAQGELSIRNKIHGISKTFSADRVSSALALEFSLDMLEQSKIEGGIVGGYESLCSNVITSSLKKASIIGDANDASAGAAAIYLSKHAIVQENGGASVEILDFIRTQSLEDLLSMVSKKYDIGLTVLPSFTLDEINEGFNKEIISLVQAYFGARSTILDTLKYFGELCSVSFLIQVIIAIRAIHFGKSNAKPVFIFSMNYSKSEYYGCILL